MRKTYALPASNDSNHTTSTEQNIYRALACIHSIHNTERGTQGPKANTSPQAGMNPFCTGDSNTTRLSTTRKPRNKSLGTVAPSLTPPTCGENDKKMVNWTPRQRSPRRATDCFYSYSCIYHSTTSAAFTATSLLPLLLVLLLLLYATHIPVNCYRC